MTPSETLKILMVDDHALIIDGYKNALASGIKNRSMMIDVAHDCDEAIHLIDQSCLSKRYDLTFIDLQLPPSRKIASIIGGDGVASYLRAKSPSTKIIILTMYGERGRIFNVINTVNPEAFLVKSDLSSAELILAVEKVMKGSSYFSETVTDFFKQRTLNDFILDKHDLEILYHLSKGVLTKNLVKHVPLSLSSIEKRKNTIKEKFDLLDGDDEQLIREAKRRGFL